jgi:prepilin-type N-terminal cleavage/methylation domain-containing protein
MKPCTMPENRFCKTQATGFTLIELAVVLVVIGLILGMVFKGRELIDQGRVKSLAAQYSKIIGASNTYYDRYGAFPGDGCPEATPASPAACTEPKNGYLSGKELGAFWHLLIDVTGILESSDQESLYGQPWTVYMSSSGMLGKNLNWLDLPGGTQADKRVCCALDKMIDDGNANTGSVIVLGGNYNPQTDCWSLRGQTNIHLKLAP